MMTKKGGSSLVKFISYMKDIAPEDCAKPEKTYPLYWLAPAKDLGVRRLRLSSLASLVEPSNHVQDSNIYHYPSKGRLVKYILSFLGLEGGSRKPAIKVVKIDGHYFVEQGHKFLQLAGALKLEYISVRVTEYSYELLKRKMQVFKYPDLELVAIATSQKGNYSYQGVSAENVEVLLTKHRIPLVDHTYVAAEACSVAPAIQQGRRREPVNGKSIAGNRPHLYLIK